MSMTDRLNLLVGLYVVVQYNGSALFTIRGRLNRPHKVTYQVSIGDAIVTFGAEDVGVLDLDGEALPVIRLKIPV